MLLRTSLIISLLAGVGVIAFGHFKVRPYIQEIISQRDNQAKHRDAEKLAKNNALTALKSANAKLQEKETALNETQSQLASAKSQAEAGTRTAAGLKEKLAKSETDYKESRQELARWEQLGVGTDKAKELIALSKGLSVTNDTLRQELNKALAEIEHGRRTVQGTDDAGEPVVLLPDGL